MDLLILNHHEFTSCLVEQQEIVCVHPSHHQNCICFCMLEGTRKMYAFQHLVCQ